MIYKILILILIFLYNGCSNKNYEESQLNKKNPNGIYGEKLSNGVIHNINYLLEYPEEYLDKNILVKGKISEVCPMRGCWLEIEDTISHERQIKDYLGLDGWADNNMVKDSKSLWKTFQIENSRQTSKIKKFSQDIPNGYNGSLLKY